jgi:hypothetical protein
MTTNNAQTEQEFIAQQKAKTANSGKGFAPAAKPDRRPVQEQPPAPAAAPSIADLNQVRQSEALTIRETVSAAAGHGSRALQALADQREQVKGVLKAEIARLTDPDLFFAELMNESADLIRQREMNRPAGEGFVLDFFDIPLELPTPRSLPMVNIAALPSSSVAVEDA